MVELGVVLAQVTIRRLSAIHTAGQSIRLAVLIHNNIGGESKHDTEF